MYEGTGATCLAMNVLQKWRRMMEFIVVWTMESNLNRHIGTSCTHTFWYYLRKPKNYKNENNTSFNSWTLYRYNFKAFIIDPSATAEVTFITPAANEVTGYTCPQLVANHKGADLQEIPPEIFAIEGEKNVFQIYFSTSANTTSFVLDQVFQKKKCYDTVTPAIELNLGPTILHDAFSYLKLYIHVHFLID